MQNNLKRPASSLTIGAFAHCAGVNVETIRFYQRKGLLLEPEKPMGSIRRYGDADVERVRFVKSAQQLGFSLDQIAELLLLHDGTHCKEARTLAEHKLIDIRQKLANLTRIESALIDLIAQCSSANGSVACPMISTLHSARGPKASTRPLSPANQRSLA